MKHLLFVLSLLIPSLSFAQGLDEEVLEVTGLTDEEAHPLVGLGLGAAFQMATIPYDRAGERPRERLVATMAGCFAVAATKEIHDHYRKDGWNSADMYNTAGPMCLIGAVFITEFAASLFIYVDPVSEQKTASIAIRF